MEKDIRKKANELYSRGLLVFNQSIGRERLELVTELWQRALELYRKIGDESKAREIEKTLVNLYKRKSMKIEERGKERNTIATRFDDWSLFFKIGCFGFGGPMAVFSLLENELVCRRRILTDEDFLEGAVLGDILPGPVTMDIVTYTGYRLKKWSGAIVSTLVFVLPSFILMTVLAMLYNKYSLAPRVEAIFKCLGAAVTGLIISVGLKLSEREVRDYRATGILIWAFASSLIFKFDILTVVGLAGMAGILLYMGGSEKSDSTRNVKEKF